MPTGLLSPCHAAITGVIPSSNTISFTFSVGGVPFATSGALALDEHSSNTNWGASHPTAGFGGLDAAYKYDATSAMVIIPPEAPVAIASQGAPAPGDGPVSIRGDFSVEFIVSGGLPSFLVPISYPIAYGGVAGTSGAFDAVVNYTSLNDGFLGSSEIHFSYAGPAGSPYAIISGSDLITPALTGLDILTLSGYFMLTADGFPGGSTEIEVFGAPEPSRALLLCAGGFAGLLLRRRRR